MQTTANPAASVTVAQLTAAWSSAPGPALTAPATLLASVTFPPSLHTDYGAPAVVWLNYTVAADGSVRITVTALNKTATRLGEATFLDFSTPLAPAASAWLAEVLDLWTDPLEVVERGSMHQHGVSGGGVAYLDAADGAGMRVAFIDTTVASPATAESPPTPLIVPLMPLAGPVTSFAAVLHSNTYNTNFNLYAMDDAYVQRFTVAVVPPSAAGGAAAAAAVQRSR